MRGVETAERARRAVRVRVPDRPRRRRGPLGARPRPAGPRAGRPAVDGRRDRRHHRPPRGRGGARAAKEIDAARTEELRASRVRIVQAADAARRQIERDLHDGAQQRLVVARARGAPRPLPGREGPGEGGRPFLERFGDELTGGVGRAARAGPRHPPRRADRARPRAGDRGARRPRAGAGRGPRRPRRPPPERGRDDGVLHRRRGADERREVRRGDEATVRVACEDDDLVVEVRDDGIGGADPGGGSGLSGLADRVEAVDGSLSVESPPGAGTLVRAVLPLAVAQP